MRSRALSFVCFALENNCIKDLRHVSDDRFVRQPILYGGMLNLKQIVLVLGTNGSQCTLSCNFHLGVAVEDEKSVTNCADTIGLKDHAAIIHVRVRKAGQDSATDIEGLRRWRGSSLQQ